MDVEEIVCRTFCKVAIVNSKVKGSHPSDFHECSGGSEDVPDWVKAFINLSVAKTECNIDSVKDQGDGCG